MVKKNKILITMLINCINYYCYLGDHSVIRRLCSILVWVLKERNIKIKMTWWFLFHFFDHLQGICDHPLNFFLYIWQIHCFYVTLLIERHLPLINSLFFGHSVRNTVCVLDFWVENPSSWTEPTVAISKNSVFESSTGLST